MSSRMVLATCSLAEKWRKYTDLHSGTYPLGMASLHAVVEAEGHSIETLFLVKETIASCVTLILSAVERMRATVLGLSVITDTRVASYRVIETAHLRFPELRIVLGGVHASTMYEQLLRRYPFAIVVLGEGELTLVDLLDAIETGRDLYEVAGIAYVRDTKIVVTPPRPLIENLDSLPFCRHDIFYSPERTEAQLLTSRGCPFACSFCALDAVSRRRVRKRSPENVVDEIELILKNFPQTRSIRILDDQFFADNKRVISICEEIVRRGIKCEFLCQARVKPISREMLLSMERAGFSGVTLGLESGSTKILEKCHKKISIQDVERAIHLFSGTSIRLEILLIIGLPGETIDTIIETIEVCRGLQKIKYHEYGNRFSDLFIYPGTEVYDIAKQAGSIDDDFWLTDGDCPRFEVENGPEAYLKYRLTLLTHLSMDFIVYPEGLRSQRDLISEILRYVFLYPIKPYERIFALTETAAQEAKRRGTLSIAAEVPWPAEGVQIMTARRKPGTEGEVLLGLHSVPNKMSSFDLLHAAYLCGLTAITEVFERCVVAFLEEGFAMNDGRLKPFLPSYFPKEDLPVTPAHRRSTVISPD